MRLGYQISACLTTVRLLPESTRSTRRPHASGVISSSLHSYWMYAANSESFSPTKRSSSMVRWPFLREDS